MRILNPVSAFLILLGVAGAQEKWLSDFHVNGANHEVNDMEIAGNYLYVAGDFDGIGSVPARGIARLGPDGWKGIGKGLPCRVSGVEATDDGTVFASCGPTIYAWSGTDWDPLELPYYVGNEKEVTAMVARGRELYFARGDAEEVWKWQGDFLVALKAGLQGWVTCMGFHDGDLVIAGHIQSVSGIQTSNIARLSSGSWQAFGSGVGAIVNRVVSHGGDLYVGLEGGIVRWDSGSGSWTPEVLEGVGTVNAYAFESTDSALYAGIYPATQGKGIAKLQAGRWSFLGGPFLESQAEIYALAAFQGSLWFGGRISNASDRSIQHLGVWDGTTFRGPGVPSLAPPGRAFSLALDGQGLIAVGLFDFPGQAEFSFTAKWAGAGWEAVGPYRGGDSYYALERSRVAASGKEGIYVAGLGLTGGDENMSGVQRYDGQAWKQIAGTLAGTSLLALQPFEGGVYLGGRFQGIDTVPARNIARWDAQGWSSVGTGANAPVRAIAMLGINMLAAGDFDTIGGVAARVGRWNGTRWTRLDAAVGTEGLAGGAVHDLMVWNNLVVAGGEFTHAGSLQAGGVAAWDGESWTTFEKGLQGKVLSLAVCQGKLYAGGAFTFTTTGKRVNGIARWNGSAWEALGEGLLPYQHYMYPTKTGIAYQLLALGPELWVTGDFQTANGIPSHNLAVWSTGGMPQSIGAGKSRVARQPDAGRFLILPGGAWTGPVGSSRFDMQGRNQQGRQGGAGWRVYRP